MKIKKCHIPNVEEALKPKLGEWRPWIFASGGKAHVTIWNGVRPYRTGESGTATLYGVGVHTFACVVFPRGSEVGLGTPPKR